MIIIFVFSSLMMYCHVKMTPSVTHFDTADQKQNLTIDIIKLKLNVSICVNIAPLNLKVQMKSPFEN